MQRLPLHRSIGCSKIPLSIQILVWWRLNRLARQHETYRIDPIWIENFPCITLMSFTRLCSWTRGYELSQFLFGSEDNRRASSYKDIHSNFRCSSASACLIKKAFLTTSVAVCRCVFTWNKLDDNTLRDGGTTQLLMTCPALPSCLHLADQLLDV